MSFAATTESIYSPIFVGEVLWATYTAFKLYVIGGKTVVVIRNIIGEEAPMFDGVSRKKLD